jgi:TM2 domain-containing membrane protein YozV/ribosomal protein L40E
MAVITCPDCGRQVSEKAEKCVGCGCPIEAAKQPKDCPECGARLVDGNTCADCGYAIEKGASAAATSDHEKFCHGCGALIHARAEICPKCGVRQPSQRSMVQTGKDKLTAALLAILLGGLGVHKFYLGDTKWGVIYLLFCWTFIPAIAGFIEGIVFLSMSDEAFQAQYGDPMKPPPEQTKPSWGRDPHWTTNYDQKKAAAEAAAHSANRK